MRGAALIGALAALQGGAAMAQTGARIAMPIVRLAELRIDPTRLDAYRVLLREEIETSIRTEPGVLMLYAVAVKGQPDRIRLTEVYADQAAYEAHLASPHFQTYKAGTAAMVRSLDLLETDPIALCDKAGLAACVSTPAQPK
ncbi:putative quinol monooxygenase [Sphingomonas sp. AP4-R1]|uniref:putative quinol monooxygenase n=1 Tax=Sphingomonas sp. AP4-R1 TaxID=2735134 RepID=UPI0020A4DC4C|nr:putative quinol monooxygenase [Sphingomonas sp. AP4-R1]